MTKNNLKDLIEVKNKAMTAFMQETENTALDAVDKFFAHESNSNLLNSFNSKWAKKSKAFYNPTGSKEKFVQGCTECRTFTDYIITACNNYGCVAEQFVNKIESSDCNSFVYTTTAKIIDTFDLASSAVQNTSTGADNNCVTVPMKKIKTFIEVLNEALCGCLAINAIALAVDQMMAKLALSFDRAILYGTWDGSDYVALSGFDSILPLLPAGQKVTAADDSALYDQIIKVSSNILTNSKCNRDRIKVLMSPSAMQRLIGTKDNNDRPILSEIKKDNSCAVQIGCLDIIECSSIIETVNAATGVLTTDIFVGIKDHYVFGHYMLPEVQAPFMNQTTLETNIPAINYYGGKLDQVSSFYRIAATL